MSHSTMPPELSVIADMVKAAFPDLGIITRKDVWLSGAFVPPCVYIEVQMVSINGNTLGSNRVIRDAGLVFHHPKDDQQRYIPIDVEPLMSLLIRERFGYRGRTKGLYINIDSETLRVDKDQKNRTDVTFRFDHIVMKPKDEAGKIIEFEIELGGDA